MLTMLPIRDLAVIRSLNEQYGVSCGLGYQLLEGGMQTGCLLYNLTQEEGEILALDAPDRLAAEGLLRAAMGSLLSQLPGKVSSFAGQMANAAKDMVMGMVNGIGDAAGWVIDKIGSLCSNALDAVKGFFGIASPSKVMRKMFQFIGQGMTLGLDDSEDGLLSSMKRLIGRAANIAEDFAPTLSVTSPVLEGAQAMTEAPSVKRDPSFTVPDVLGFLDSVLTRLEERPIIISIKADERELARVVRRYAPC